jgi:hypothetical protein
MRTHHNIPLQPILSAPSHEIIPPLIPDRLCPRRQSDRHRRRAWLERLEDAMEEWRAAERGRALRYQAVSMSELEHSMEKRAVRTMYMSSLVDV